MAKKFAACKNAAASANDAAAQIQWEKRLFAQHFVGSLADGSGIQTVLTQQVPCRAGAAKLVLHAHTAHRGGQLFAQHGADGLAQTADDIVLLGGDDLAAFLCSLEDDLLVQRLDGVDVDDPGMDALGSQLFRGNAGFLLLMIASIGKMISDRFRRALRIATPL